MRIIRYCFIATCLALGAINPASARVSIDLHLSLFPELVPLPGYPVYYAPAIDSNYFFYDGRYWLFDGDDWYESAWYNGPWEYVERDYVPLYVLRVPVRYYRRPPPYFHGWYYDAPPRWGHRWGPEWERRHRGWDQWDRRRTPALAPLPTYQRRYSGDRYPDREKQRHIHERNYQQPSRAADERREIDRPERVREPDRSDRRDHINQHPNEVRRVIPRPQDDRDDNSASTKHERNQRFDDKRELRERPHPQFQMQDNRTQKMEGRGQPNRQGGREQMRDSGNRNDQSDRGEGKR